VPGSMAVVAVSYGSVGLLKRNLSAVAHAAPSAAVVVVDNFSSDQERQDVAALCDERSWHLVAPSANLGFGAGVNLGVGRAQDLGCTDYLIINPDATIDAGSVDSLRQCVEADRLTLVSPTITDPDGRVWFAGLDLYLDDGSIKAPRRRVLHPDRPHVEWVSGACLWVTAEVWDAVGGFDEDYFLYWEDVDFSRRAVAAGITLHVDVNATAVHDEGLTHREEHTRSEAKSDTYYYFNIRNRMMFAAKHLDAEGVRRWQSSATSNAYAVLLRGGRRQFIRPVGPLRAAIRGLRDGRRLASAALTAAASHRR
jgi:N-acetylglucosaminyl-diphospho-decaprenol L-rhamnosyltransferase